MQVSEATGIRIPNGKLDGITSFGALKEFVIEQMDKRSKTLGNPIEELYDFREPPSNMRIVQYRNYASGGPIVIKDWYFEYYNLVKYCFKPQIVKD